MQRGQPREVTAKGVLMEDQGEWIESLTIPLEFGIKN